MPSSLWDFAVGHATKTINMVPNTKCWPRPPNEVIGRDKPTFDVDTDAFFGKVALFKVPTQPSPSSDGESRLESGIVLGKERSNGNTLTYLIASRQIVTRGAPIDTPLTDDLIKSINQIADDDDKRDEDDSPIYEWVAGDGAAIIDHEEPEHTEDTSTSTWTPHVLAPHRNKPSSSLDTVAVPEESTTPADGEDRSNAAPNTLSNSLPTSTAPTSDVTNSEPDLVTVEFDLRNEPEAAEDPPAPDEAVVGAAPNHGYNLRPKRSSWRNYTYHVSLGKALKMDRSKSETAAKAEISQLIERGVWTPVKHAPVGEKILYSSMFMKEKYDAAGKFDKYKARLVAGGDAVEPDTYNRGETSSPTVYLDSLMLILSIAAINSMSIGTLDFPGAYLNAALTKTHYMRLGAEVADIAAAVGGYEHYIRRDNTIIVKLNRALYGLPESGALWFQRLSTSLKDLRFTPSRVDACVFTRRSGDHLAIIAVYLYDLLIAASSDAHLDTVIQEIRSSYPDVKAISVFMG
jgi:hypothetical protein